MQYLRVLTLAEVAACAWGGQAHDILCRLGLHFPRLKVGEVETEQCHLFMVEWECGHCGCRWKDADETMPAL